MRDLVLKISKKVASNGGTLTLTSAPHTCAHIQESVLMGVHIQHAHRELNKNLK